MRRRLWWQICLLDSHAAEDRATNPVINADSFSTKLPLQINDDDLRVDSYAEVEERQGFTDMTFCLICHEIMDTARQLNYVPVRELGQPQTWSQENWTQRINAVIHVQRRIEERYLRHLNLARPFHWATRTVADVITAIMWLIVYRPLQKRPVSSSSSHLADPGILGLSVEVLERAHQFNTDPAASPYRWLGQTYVQWHALAVTIAELCVKTEGPVVDRAWAILMPVFSETSQHVADSNEGMLWRPIKKLMNRAQVLRQEYVDARSAHVGSSASRSDEITTNHGVYKSDVGAPMLGMAHKFPESVERLMQPVEELQPVLPSTSSAPLNWDPWLAAASTSWDTSVRSQHNGNMDQMAWNNWENFVDGFQGQDDIIMYGPDPELSKDSSIWP